MATTNTVRPADLSGILGSLRNLNDTISTMSNRVGVMGAELNQTRADLSRLERAFADFVESDVKAKELALAETRQVKVRQELETKYEYYGIVRRHATGILQASDIQLVRKETLRGATEELMISAPRYWLAPALVALSAWLGDNRELAERALAEAIRRDDEKTSLFFALIARRAGRNEVNRIWLDRYFGMQNPYKLNRQTVVMVDALANGVFGVDVTLHCGKRIAAWIAELSEQAGFIEAQRVQWSKALMSKTPTNDHSVRYPNLYRFSPTWPALNQAINSAATHEMVLAHFQSMFQGEIQPAASVLAAVDELLSKLVTSFDDEELPLRRQEELCRLVIEEGGNRRAAQARYDLQASVLDDGVDFTQLLTNAAMHPDVSHVTRATQRFAVAHSRDWILDGYGDVTAKTRLSVPADVSLSIEDWQGVTRDGDNEAELVQSLEQEIAARATRKLGQMKWPLWNWLVLAGGVFLIIHGLSSGWFLPAVGVFLLLVCWGSRIQYLDARKAVQADFAKLCTQTTEALKACLAEVVEARREIAERDGVATHVTAYLEGISPEQHILSSRDSVRRVMIQP
ncbi:hypothetical protein [Achromobacter ruhlandii]|uniref:hypothetical protein n=1 Tax=Achromobacter ruhlandii TaxID=72557 RepID=UPI003BA3C481